MSRISQTVEEAEDEAFLRQLVLPEEDRAKYTSQPWSGEYRWFRSPNVVCLEHYRRRPAGQHNGPTRTVGRLDR